MKILIRKFFCRFNWPFLGALVFICFGILYINLVQPVFSSTSRVVIFRNKVENPDEASDEARNRWIWIRDGLNVSSALVTDDLLRRFVERSSSAQSETKHLDSETAKLKFLKSLVKIQFTGADENNYQIDVQSSNQVLALELNQHVFAYLRYLSISKDSEDFNSIIQAVHAQAEEFAFNSPEFQFYKTKVMKLKFDHALSQTQRQKGFRVITYPHVDDKPIWPKPLAILIVFAVAGLLVGYSVLFFGKKTVIE
jgi:uncharacterized protein involved in exopolysaccharide biosynthesis